MAGPRAFGYDFDYRPVEELPVPALDCRLGSTSAAPTPTRWSWTGPTGCSPRPRCRPPGHHRRDRRRDRRGARRARREPRPDHPRDVGTTHATNAVLERKKLRRVAVIRIGGPATHSIRPMFDWPRDLAAAVGRRHVSWTAASSSTAATCPRSTATPSRGSSARSAARPTASPSPACSPRCPRGTNCGRRDRQARARRVRSRSAMRSARWGCSSGRTPPS